MRVYGIDFTSRPSRRKPITCLCAELHEHRLDARELLEWDAFEPFEQMLQSPGPWIAGVDFPFGMARRFVENIGWPARWPEYVGLVGDMGRERFRSTLDGYRAQRAAGDKEHRRRTDTAAGAISPQKLYGTPVGLMFFEGAPRLRAAGVSIPGLLEGDPARIVVEAYPGLLARQLIGRRAYKQDSRAKQTTDQHEARAALLSAVLGGGLPPAYALSVKAPATLADDPGGDHLDALLCAVQAAWAWRQRDANFGVPRDTDPLEGAIAAPMPASLGVPRG
jgi:hypothetical protein